MNTNFNTIETIRTDATITNKSAAYLAACDTFKADSQQYFNNDNFVARKSVEMVSLAYDKANHADGEFSIYLAARACEGWLAKAWNNAEKG